MKKKACLLLPAYNEAKNIGSLLKDLSRLDQDNVDWTILVVDDGSKDETGTIAKKSGAVVVTHERNRGVGAAFRTGLEWIVSKDFELLLHMDSDGQVPVTEVAKVLEPVISGRADLAMGSRFSKGVPKHFDLWKGWMLCLLARGVGMLLGYRILDMSCGIRCMNRHVMNGLKPTFDYDYIQQTLIQALSIRPKLVEVPVNVIYDPHAKSRGMGSKIWTYGWRFISISFVSLLQAYWVKAVGSYHD